MDGNLYDALYSWSLLFALVAAIPGALLFGFFLVMRLLRRGVNRYLPKVANAAASIALIATIFSVTVHFAFGHAAGSPEPMGVAEFVLEHKAYWVVLVLAAFGYLGPTLVEPRHQSSAS